MNKTRQSTVGLILGMVFVVSLISGTIMYFSDMHSYWSIYLLSGIIFIGWLINRVGHEKLSALILIGAILASIQFNIYRGYGIHDVAIIAWPAVIFFSGLLFGSRVMPYFTVLTGLLAVMAMFFPNAQGFLGEADTSDLIVLVVVLVAFSLIAQYILHSNEITLKRLQRSEERAQAIFNSVNDPIFIQDAKTGAILDVNNKMLEMYGYSRDEVLKLDIEAISSGLAPYQQTDAMKWLAKSISQGPQIFEWQARNKLGQLFWVDVNMSQAVIGGQSQVVVSVRDISERKQAEADIRVLNAELEQRVGSRTTALEAANRELEAFAYSVSHDLRAPLRAMSGFCSILLDEYQSQLDPQGQNYLVRIRDASQHMGELINALLNLSRYSRAELTRQVINLSKLAREISMELLSQAPERHVQFEIAENLVANGDYNLVKVLLENLLGNAHKFTNQRDQALIQMGVTVQSGEKVYFVRDNGAGFNMDYAGKLFAPFQRLHGVQEFPGSGIGLATVQRIITRHGGRIWAEAAVDQGAAFYFTLGKN